LCRVRSLLLAALCLSFFAGLSSAEGEQARSAAVTGTGPSMVLPARVAARRSELPGASANGFGQSAAASIGADCTVGDLDALRERGRLRILIPANIGGVFYLPREGWPVEAQHEAAESFARGVGLEPELVPVERFGDMIPALLSGKGDLIAANLTITGSRREKIAFSVPLTTVRQQVLVARSRDDIVGIEDLAGKRVMLDPASSFWERLQASRERLAGIQLVERPSGMTDEEELDQVASGRVDASVRDSNIAIVYLAYRDDLKVAFSLPGTDDIAWGIRPDAPQLRAALNEYLHLEFLADTEQSQHRDDLDGIRKRRVLRVLLPNNAASYFLYRGELHGFEYDLAKAFADANRLRLEVIVPDTHEQLIDWLLEGRADVAAGFLEPSDRLRARGVRFSRPYHHAARHLVVHAKTPVSCARDIQGRKVTVRRSSPYWNELLALRAQGARFEMEAAPEDRETEELIGRVARGEIEATVADGHLLDIELARGIAVKSGFQLSEQRSHAVAVRAGDSQLLAALNDFIRKEYKGLVYNLLYRKYFTSQRTIRDLAAGRPGGEGNKGLSPYDELTRRYAEQYGFDWRLIVAQMYQESRFDPDARSFAGAQGLMQVLPRTAKSMGFSRVTGPEESIHAGVKYLDWVRNRFEPTLPFNERMWFSLAAYNAGHGHVADARRLARQQGLDGDRWFDNTEKAMLLLSKKPYASKARYGYVRGSEPVSYVRDIRQRYRAYVKIVSRRLSQRAAAGEAQAALAVAGRVRHRVDQ
jgi:membrane-bound lytic murein transglycosylase F